MKIEQAVEALEEGKTINSANAAATIKPKTVEGEKRVEITRTNAKGKADVMDMTLSRMKQLYKVHTFALGPYKMAPSNKASAPAETK